MARPLMQHGVGQLEGMFAKGKADPKVLKQLENELRHRQVPRAIALLADVQAAMSGGAAVPKVPSEPALPPVRVPEPLPQQPDLWVRPTPPPVADIPPTTPVRPDIPVVIPPEPQPLAKAPQLTTAMPLEDAYKVLKVTAGAQWESIEQARRTLVQLAHLNRPGF